MTIDSNTSIFLGQREIVEIKKGNTTIWQKSSVPVVEPDYFYIENTFGENGNLVIKVFNNDYDNNIPSSSYTHSIEYSKNKTSWTTLNTVTSTNLTYQIPIDDGEKVYFRNDSGVFNYNNGGPSYDIRFNADNITFSAGGDIRTLLNYRDVENTTMSTGCFSNLFSSYTYTDEEEGVDYDIEGKCIDASDLTLPSSVAPYCYQFMFNYCTALTDAPSLPSTTLKSDCYNNMFAHCYSLIDAPSLPATTLAPRCYYGMFYDCSALDTAPALPATNLEEACYANMFGYCYALTTAPALPATTLVNSCYIEMFQQSGLTAAPSLPATTLAQNCYSSMFSGCQNLTTAPALPATKLENSCYSYMFSDCQSLTTAPLLPATTLAQSCYNAMFQTCISLVNAPALPATTLTQYCYQSMFQACTSLETITIYADDISASNCLENWCGDATWEEEGEIYGDFFSQSGTFYNGGSATYTQDDPSGIPTGWTETSAPAITSVTSMPNTFTAKSWMDKARVSYTIVGHNTTGIDVPLSNVTEKLNIGVNTGNTSLTYTESNTYDNMSYTYTITQSANDTDEPDWFWVEYTSSGTRNLQIRTSVHTGTPTEGTYIEKIEWSKDKNTWTEETLSTSTPVTISISQNEKVYFRNDNGKFNTTTRTTDFYDNYAYAYYNVGGNIRTLLDYINPNVQLTEVEQFDEVFALSGLRNAEHLILPFTELTNYCYREMFMSRSYLLTPPTLPATKLAQGCYMYMFMNCTALTTTPVLPATTLENDCYNSMFSGCTSLRTAPLQLPADTLAENCYQNMFQGCTSLTTSPSLPATTLASNCYQSMFKGCTSLTTAPELPATMLRSNCYNSMFYGCTALTTAPATLPATTLTTSCYRSMFSYCYSLTDAPTLLATTLSTYCCYSMFQGCTSLTTAPELPATMLGNNCYNSMFYGCTALTTAPATLPATTLTTSCYQNMFKGCTSLVTAPVLPATTTQTYCYNSMFDGCTSLNTVIEYLNTNYYNNALAYWLNNVSPTGTFYKLGSANLQSGPNGIPTGWTVETTPPN